MDVVVWLQSLGLGRYEAAFRKNEIDEMVLPNLTAVPEGAWRLSRGIPTVRFTQSYDKWSEPRRWIYPRRFRPSKAGQTRCFASADFYTAP